jgi:hypothetical protein
VLGGRNPFHFQAKTRRDVERNHPRHGIPPLRGFST